MTETLPRSTKGPLVSDEQWAADQEWVNARLHRRQIASGWETEVLDEGQGETILCIPIVAHVEVIYARQLREFSRDHRVITYRRAEGKNKPISLAERGEEIRRLLDGLDLDRVHILARSEGGMVAAEFAKRYPERVKSLVLITVAMDYVAHDSLRRDNIMNWFILHTPIPRFVGDEKFRHEVVEYLSGPEQRLTYDQLMQVYRNIPDFHKMYKYSAAPLLLQHDLRRDAGKLTAPTLLISSEEDPRARKADVDKLARALPDCRGIHVYPEGGRFVNYIMGDEVNAVIREFYDELEKQPAEQATPASA